MKKLIILYLLLLGYGGLGAQSKNKISFYNSGEINFGNYVGGNLNANILFNKSLALQIGFSGNRRKSPAQPYNYKIDESWDVLNLSRFKNKHDYFGGFHVLMGKIFWLNETNSSRLNLLGGLGFTKIIEYSNWVLQPDGSGSGGSNYTYDIIKYNKVSVVFNPRIEFTGKKFFGTSISLLLQANPKRALMGIQFGVMIGDLK